MMNIDVSTSSWMIGNGFYVPSMVEDYNKTNISIYNDCITKGDDVVLSNVAKHVFPADSDEFFEYADRNNKRIKKKNKKKKRKK
ncbi:hypothetical protein RFY15_03265, partial [Acinetobacter baumannii]|nr:hypothetical protein [Acinetobacter baumannii]